jgi:hypothetical protein
MSATLLATKLHFPRVRSNWVLRPRLVRLLEQGLWRPLTLISTPEIAQFQPADVTFKVYTPHCMYAL